MLPAQVCQCVGVHRRSSRMSPSLYLQHILFVFLGYYLRWKVGGHLDAVLWGTSSKFCLKQQLAFLHISHLAFTWKVSLETRWFNHTVVQTQSHLRRNPVLFSQRNEILLWSITCQLQITSSLCVCWHQFNNILYY